MSTAAHMTGNFVREQCPFATYSTYLMSKQPSLAADSTIPVATPCALYCPYLAIPRDYSNTIPRNHVNSCNSSEKYNCQNNKSFCAVHHHPFGVFNSQSVKDANLWLLKVEKHCEQQLKPFPSKISEYDQRLPMKSRERTTVPGVSQRRRGKQLGEVHL